jgi:hypothetical protein
MDYYTPRPKVYADPNQEVHRNQGRNLESHLTQEMLHPQSDGMVERNTKSVEEHLRKVVELPQTRYRLDPI